MNASPAMSPVDQLQRAVEVLTKNWILALPTALASLLLSVIVVFLVVTAAGSIAVGHAVAGGIGTAAGVGTGLLIALVGIVVGVAVLILAQAVVISAAEDAWQGRTVNLGASLNTVLGRVPDLIVAFVLSFLIMLIPIALAFVVIGIPLILVAGYFLMYVTPAVVIGRQGGMDAIKTSFRLSRYNVGPSIVAFIGIIVAAIVGNLASSLTSHIPFVNFIVAFAVGGLTAAFSALVAARFYDLLSGNAQPFSSPMSTMPMPAGGGDPPTIIR